MGKKRALLVMAATGNYLFSVGNVLLGLKKYSPEMFDDIIIYTNKTALPSDKAAIKKIFPVEFKIFDWEIPNETDRKRLTYYSNMPYARYEMLTYLDRYEKVVWFDSDFYITDDISGLLNYGDQTGVAMAIDIDPYPEGHSINAFFVKPVPNYDMSAKAYASGLVIFTDKIKKPLELRNYLYQKTDEFSSYIKYAEQGILHLMVQDFNLEIEEFPKLIYHAFPNEDKSHARIVHLLGGNKPWDYYMYGAYSQWYLNHAKWISLGGSECEAFKRLLKEAYYLQVFIGENRYENIMQKYEMTKEKLELENKITECRDYIPKYVHSLIQKIFSIRNSYDRTHKILTIFGIKLKFKKLKV